MSYEILKKFNFWGNNNVDPGFIRNVYLDRLIKMNSTKTIVTVTGLRRVGKSYIVRQFIDHLITNKGVDRKQIFYANLFIRELDFLKDPSVFQEMVTLWQKNEKVNTKKRMYIVIDEVQEISDWQKLVSSYYENYLSEYKIIITGSNSKLLAGEMGTYLAGRSFELVVYPLSFNEYLLFKKVNASTDILAQYLNDGGMPEIILTDNRFARNNLVETTIDSVIMRDIVSRYDIRNINLLRKIVDYLSFSVTDEVSKNKVSNTIKSGGEKVSNHTVSNYIEYLKNAFFLYECPVFSPKKNDIISSKPCKIYLNDSVFVKKGQNHGDFGKLLENHIFIELKRRGYDVYTVKMEDKEVDFLAQKNGERWYLQSAWTVGDTDSEVYQREFGNLLKIHDHFPKTVISMDPLTHTPDKGINHIRAINFFSEKV
ncbi:MAG: ATP-binding protein [bacterium]